MKCQRTGAILTQREASRGRMVIKPYMKRWVTSPRQANDYMFEQTDKDSGGLFWVFTENFSLSKQIPGGFEESKYKNNSLLADLTLSLLQNINVHLKSAK